MKSLVLHYKLETFNDSGKEVKKPVRGEGWYLDDSMAKQIGVCILLPSPKKGISQTLYISAKELRAFAKAMPK